MIILFGAKVEKMTKNLSTAIELVCATKLSAKPSCMILIQLTRSITNQKELNWNYGHQI